MAIQVASFIVPKNNNTWYVLEDKYLKGGLRVVANVTERNNIDSLSRKAAMLVITQDDKKVWQLNADLSTWTEFKVGGGSAVRQTVQHSTIELQPGASDVFALNLGRSVLVYHFEVDTPCTVEAHGSVLRDDSNPYKFVATSDHLVDDGSSLMTDGTILRGRRYAILANTEPGNSGDIYFQLTNNDVVAKNVNLTLTFLPLETV
jgi:hypothetical protein